MWSSKGLYIGDPFDGEPAATRNGQLNGPFTVSAGSPVDWNLPGFGEFLDKFVEYEKRSPVVAAKQAVNSARRRQYYLKKEAEKTKRQNKQAARLRALKRAPRSEGVAVSEPPPKKMRS